MSEPGLFVHAKPGVVVFVLREPNGAEHHFSLSVAQAERLRDWVDEAVTLAQSGATVQGGAFRAEYRRELDRRTRRAPRERRERDR